MRTVRVQLNAAGSAQDMSGGMVIIAESVSGAAGEVTLTWLARGREERGVIEGVSPGRKYKPGFYFEGFRLNGDADAVVTLLVGGEGADADILGTDDLAFITNTSANAVPVEVFNQDPIAVSLGGTQPVSIAGTVAVNHARPTALTNVAPVPVTAAVTPLLAAVVARRIVYFRNVGADVVALGAAGLTFANAAVYVQPGETWIEENAPGVAWFGICDAGLTATVNILTGA